MAIAKNHLTLSRDSRDFLLAQLRALADASRHAHRRRSRCLAVTFRPSRRGRDGVPDRPIPFDQFRMIALSYRWSRPGRHGPRKHLALATYRPTLDLPGTGGIVFRPERAYDAAAPRTLIGPPINATAIRSALALHQAVEDADPADFAPGLDLPRFFYGFDPGSTPDFGPIHAAAAAADERAIDGLRAWPAELFVGDGRSSLNRPPAQIFATLAAHKGRRVRNPAYAVLRRRGILPAGPTYRAWRATVRRHDGTIQDPHTPGTEAARTRRAIQDHLFADPAREPAILAELAAACAAMGVKIADGPDGVDALAALLDNPWDRPAVPYAAAVQLVRLGGSPRPTSMTFSDGAASVDLFDLGRDGSRPASEVGPGGIDGRRV
jgi:hypothetical protein